MPWNGTATFASPVAELREREKGMTDKPDRSRNTVSLPALREGKSGLVVATQIARYVRKGSPLPGWNSPEQAWAQSQAQLAWYQTMVDAGEMVQILETESLEKQIKIWEEHFCSGSGESPLDLF